MAGELGTELPPRMHRPGGGYIPLRRERPAGVTPIKPRSQAGPDTQQDRREGDATRELVMVHGERAPPPRRPPKGRPRGERGLGSDRPPDDSPGRAVGSPRGPNDCAGGPHAQQPRKATRRGGLSRGFTLPRSGFSHRLERNRRNPRKGSAQTHNPDRSSTLRSRDRQAPGQAPENRRSAEAQEVQPFAGYLAA